MDPFEARLTFLDLLSRLTAAQPTIQRAAQYALRHEELCEDLYSCVLEELDQASINARVNLLYILDALVQPAVRGGFTGYRDRLGADLKRVIRAVVPEGAGGAVNLSQTHKVLTSWRRKQIFPKEQLAEVEQMLGSHPKTPSASATGAAGEEDQRWTLSKEEILRRMEEDRERHKRTREEAWMRASASGENIVLDGEARTTDRANHMDFDVEFELAWQASLAETGDSAPRPYGDTAGTAEMEENRQYLPEYDWSLTQRESWRSWWSDEEDTFLTDTTTTLASFSRRSNVDQDDMDLEEMDEQN